MKDKLTVSNNDLLTNKEAAEHLGYSAETLKGSRSKGVLAGVPAPHFIVFGTRGIRYKRVDLDNWLHLTTG